MPDDRRPPTGPAIDAPAPTAADALTVSIVGAGRLGRVLARALRASGADVHGPARRGEPVPPADVVLLCVPDMQVAAAATAARGAARFVGHTSGATVLEGSGADFAWHPLQTFTGDENPDAFHGIGCAVAGCSDDALDVARALATRLGAEPFALADADRGAYHAAATLASNYLLSLFAAAERIAAAAGIPQSRALLAPLVRTTVHNWIALGPADALTGPVRRGDEATVARQRAAVVDAAGDLVPLFDALTEQTRTLAGRGAGAQ